MHGEAARSKRIRNVLVHGGQAVDGLACVHRAHRLADRGRETHRVAVGPHHQERLRLRLLYMG